MNVLRLLPKKGLQQNVCDDEKQNGEPGHHSLRTICSEVFKSCHLFIKSPGKQETPEIPIAKSFVVSITPVAQFTCF